MLMRLAEVVFTLTQFPTVEGVNFKLDGKAIDVLGGEGIIIDHPMGRATTKTCLRPSGRIAHTWRDGVAAPCGSPAPPTCLRRCSASTW